MSVVLKGGRLVDPASGRDEVIDISISGPTVVGVGASLSGDEIIDVSGCVVAPGFVDLHTHLREPGREDEETIASGSAAAAAGGYTSICAMPNTDPVADNAAVVEKVWALGREAGLVEVVPAGALTRGLNGQEMADFGEMYSSPARVRLFTDDGKGLQDALIARRVMEYLRGLGAVYAEHCEVEPLARGGHMNESEISYQLGLRGIPAAAEELMVARDIALCRLTGCSVHFLHVSTLGSVELIREAKGAGLPVTAEATPHHFTLTDRELIGYEPNAKVNPPLRAEADREAVVAGLADRTIDAIATDHAPHSPEEKDQELEYAPPGLVGLETALGLALTELVATDHLNLIDVVERLSSAPARILDLDGQGGPIADGKQANICVFDPDDEWTVDPAMFVSKSRNTPFEGRKLRGRVRHTFFKGRHVVRDGRVLEEVRT
jgi:dihydroorotase